MKTLHLEDTVPFQGLAELVAYNEGLFEQEGLNIEWVARDTGLGFGSDHYGSDFINTTDPKEANPFASHGKPFEEGRSDMYNACEWGNYCRVQDSQFGGRQIGRRSVLTFTALVVRPDSKVYTAQQLAGKPVGVPFYFGSHYAALHMLEGFLTRDQIKLQNAPNRSYRRYKLLMSGELEAVSLSEPFLSLAEKNGCRLIVSTFYHGTEVVSDKVDDETYEAFKRAVGKAVKRIDANKEKYLQYFIDYHKDSGFGEDLDGLTVSDLRASRIVVVDPAPIPEDEMKRTVDWLKSWDMLDKTENHLDLVRAA